MLARPEGLNLRPRIKDPVVRAMNSVPITGEVTWPVYDALKLTTDPASAIGCPNNNVHAGGS